MARGRGQSQEPAGLRAPSQAELEAHWRGALDYLDDNYSFFLTDVLNMGKPEWHNGIPTAAVAVKNNDQEGVIGGTTNFRFLFNPHFATKLDTEELAFVAAHETMHILLNHLDLGKKWDDQKLANIAMDCVINDYLSANGMKQVEGTIVGADTVGYDCAYVPVSQVYDDLKQQQQQDPNGMGEKMEQYENGGGALDSHDWIFDENGEISEEAIEKIKEAVEKAMEEGESGGMPQEIEGLASNSHAQSTSQSSAGTGDGAMRKFMAESGVTLAWAELMKELDPDIFKAKGAGPQPQPTFRKAPRKLGAVYPDVVLPIYEVDDHKVRKPEKPMIVIALDVSGSVRQPTVDRFLTLAKSIPRERVHLFPCVFNTSYQELDLDNTTIRSGGGTDFSAVEKYIRDVVMPANNGRYPKSVVVVTDGQAGFGYGQPEKDQQKGWYWLLEDHYGTAENFVKGFFGRAAELKKFTKK
jgi:predicted metal-dependent peptidase